MKKLNTKGFSHIILPLLVVLVIAAIGTYVLKASHADTPAGTAVSGPPVPTPDPNWSAPHVISNAGLTYKSPGIGITSSTNSTAPKIVLTYQYAKTPTVGSWGTLTCTPSGSCSAGSYIGSGRINGFPAGTSGPTVTNNQVLYQTNSDGGSTGSIAIYCGTAGSGNDTGVPKSSGAVTLNPAVIAGPNSTPVNLFTNIGGKLVEFQATNPCTGTWTGPTTVTSNIMASTAPAAAHVGSGQIAAAYLNKYSKVEVYLSGTKWTHVGTLANKTGYTVVGSPALVSTGNNAVKLMVTAQSSTGQTVLLQADNPDVTKYGFSTLTLAQTNVPATNQLIQPVIIGDGYIHLYVTDQVKGTIYQFDDKL